MDNIQKSIVAVLGIAAFVTVIIPDMGGTNTKAVQPVPASQPNAMPPPRPSRPSQNDSMMASENPEEYSSFGQPMSNAEPMEMGTSGGWGQPIRPSQSEPIQSAPAFSPGATTSPPPGVTPPGATPSPPPGVSD